MVFVHPARWCTSPLGGRARWVRGRRWPLSRRRQTSKGVSFFISLKFHFGGICCTLFQEYDYGIFNTAGYASS